MSARPKIKMMLHSPRKSRNQGLARFFPGVSKRPILVMYLVIILLSTCAFGVLAKDVIRRDSLVLNDPSIGNWLLSHTSTAGSDLFYAITLLGTTLVVVSGMAAFGLWLAREKRWLQLGMLLTSIGGGTLLNLILKSVFTRPRPDFINAFYQETSYSFPSGHAMTSVFVYGAVAYLLGAYIPKRKGRYALYASAALLAFLIGFSRLYLGVHYLTDVLAGWSAGIAWLFTCILVTESLRLPE
jgi:membrane-associated phospholipid phosphatase